VLAKKVAERMGVIPIMEDIQVLNEVVRENQVPKQIKIGKVLPLEITSMRASQVMDKDVLSA
jgi:hypothetical protein